MSPFISSLLTMWFLARRARRAPEVPGGDGAIGFPPLADGAQSLRRRPLPASVRDAVSLAHPEVVDRQHVGSSEREDQEHLDRPSPDPVNPRQLLDDRVVVEPRRRSPRRHPARDRVPRDVLDRPHLAARKPARRSRAERAADTSIGDGSARSRRARRSGRGSTPPRDREAVDGRSRASAPRRATTCRARARRDREGE